MERDATGRLMVGWKVISDLVVGHETCIERGSTYSQGCMIRTG